MSLANDGELMRARRFIIVCPARSGSTMLVHLVRSHPDCVSNSEVMAFTDDVGGFDASVRDQLGTRGSDRDLVRWRKKDPTSFMHELAFHAGGRPRVGFKIKSDELVQRKYRAVLDALRADRDLSVIHLNRRNLLERYVSWVLVNEVTGVTLAVREEDRPEFRRVHIDPRHAQKDFELAEERRALVDGWFGDHRMLHVDYEDIVTDPDDVSDLLCGFLEVSPRPLTTSTIKLAPDVSDIVTNYDELREYFSETRFAPLFERPCDHSPRRPSAVAGGAAEAEGRIRVPNRLLRGADAWGEGGAPLHHYLAELTDRADLTGVHMLANAHHTDMLQAVASGSCRLASYTGVGASPALVEWCGRKLDRVTLDTDSIEAGAAACEKVSRADLVVAALPASPSSHQVEQAAIWARRRVVAGSSLILVAAMQGFGSSPREVAGVVAAHGWRPVEERGPRRSFGPHIVFTAV